MVFSMVSLLVALFATPIVAKQPDDFFAVSQALPPAPANMNADFFEDPQTVVPSASAPADGPSELLVHMEALPPAPAPAMDDAPETEAMPPAPVPGDFDSQEAAAPEAQMPTWADYAAQQSTNAQLAERVAELTKASHLLWREERTLRQRGHKKILQLKHKCHIRKEVHDQSFPDEEKHVQKNLRNVLPVSLTHHATRHHRINKAGNDAVGAAAGADQGPLIGTSVGTMAEMYNAGDGTHVAHDEKDGSQEAGKKRQLEDELAASRARLGRNEEARLHIEDQIRELEEKFQKGMRDAEQRQQDLVAAQKRQRAKELELKNVKKQTMATQGQDSTVSAALRNELGAHMKMASDRIEQEKKDLLVYRDQADVKLRARKNEAKNLQGKNTELRNELQTSSASEKNIKDQLKAAQDTWSRLTGQVEALHRDEVEVSQEQQTEEQRLAFENDKLRSEAEQERQCMDWGHRLDTRIQHELQRKVSDAKLCRDSILSLHNERLELKARSAKYKREVEEEKLRESEARRSYEENQQLLDHCLGQMTR